VRAVGDLIVRPPLYLLGGEVLLVRIFLRRLFALSF
jgi:hypothetical protein